MILGDTRSSIRQGHLSSTAVSCAYGQATMTVTAQLVDGNADPPRARGESAWSWTATAMPRPTRKPGWRNARKCRRRGIPRDR